MAHGVRKVNEFIVRDGRALIMTKNVASSTTKDQWDSIADGTLYISPINGDFRYKKTGSGPRVWDRFTPDNLFSRESIGGHLIDNLAITEPKLHKDSVSTRTIIDRNINGDKIAFDAIRTEHFEKNTLEGSVVKDNTMHGSKLTGNTVHGSKIEGNTITGDRLEQGAINTRELYDLAVKTGKIDNLAVTAGKLAKDAVTEIKIENGAVKTDKIYGLAVTYEKLAKPCVDWDNLKIDSVRTNAIKNLAIKTDKIDNLAVTDGKIANFTITDGKMAPKTLTNASIENGTITLGLLETSLQSIVNNAVIHDSKGTARVHGDLQVDKNIKSTSNNKAFSITGFKVYNPVFADYAEGFVTSEPVSVGDIVEIDKHGCVKKAGAHSMKIVGVVSDRFGMCLDADEEELRSGAKTAIGLLGKVPVNIVGKVEAGDFIISTGDGIGIATKKYIPGTIVGKALNDKETYGLGQVLCLINPM